MTFTSVRIRTGWVFAEREKAEQAAPELQQDLRAMLAAPELFVMPDTDFDAANLRAHRVPDAQQARAREAITAFAQRHGYRRWSAN